MRNHGILAPAARDRALVVRRPKSPGPKEQHTEPLPLLAHPGSWASLLKRAYELDLSTCPTCGGRLRVLDVVLRADVIDEILAHLNRPTVRYHLESGRAFVDAAWNRFGDSRRQPLGIRLLEPARRAWRLNTGSLFDAPGREADRRGNDARVRAENRPSLRPQGLHVISPIGREPKKPAAWRRLWWLW